MKDFFTFDEVMRDFLIFVGFSFFIYFIKNIAPLSPTAIQSGETWSALTAFLSGRVDFSKISTLFAPLYDILGLLTVVLFAAVVWISLRANDFKKQEREKYKPIPVELNEKKALMTEWEVVVDHVNSPNPAEWKLAILEADSMLDEILDAEGYQGESLGEKLKSMSPNAIASYNDLWEAHKVRNQIAHEGASVELTQKMARDTINRFEVAFKELGHI